MKILPITAFDQRSALQFEALLRFAKNGRGSHNMVLSLGERFTLSRPPFSQNPALSADAKYGQIKFVESYMPTDVAFQRRAAALSRQRNEQQRIAERFEQRDYAEFIALQKQFAEHALLAAMAEKNVMEHKALQSLMGEVARLIVMEKREWEEKLRELMREARHELQGKLQLIRFENMAGGGPAFFPTKKGTPKLVGDVQEALARVGAPADLTSIAAGQIAMFSAGKAYVANLQPQVPVINVSAGVAPVQPIGIKGLKVS